MSDMKANKNKAITRMIQEEKQAIRHMVSKARFLKLQQSRASAVTMERKLNWTKIAKGGRVVPRSKAEVVITIRSKDTGKVIEQYKSNSLQSIQSKQDYYNAIYRVEMI